MNYAAFITNPAFLYTVIWGMALFLYSLGLSGRLLSLEASYIIYLLCSALSFILGWLFALIATNRLVVKAQIDVSSYTEFFSGKNIKLNFNILYFSLCLYFLGFLYAGNFPLLSMLGLGPYVNYASFGVPVLHGFTNSLFMLSFLFLVFRFFLKAHVSYFKYFSVFALFMFVPILLVNRQMLVSMIVQFFLVYIMLKGLSIRKVVFLIFLSFFLVYIFGLMGDFRSSRASIMYLADLNFNYPESWPSGPVWFYVYFVSPLNNLFNNLNVDPSYLPISLLSGLIPSSLRDTIIGVLGVQLPEWELVYWVLNVSSFHSPILRDFGPYLAHAFFFWTSFFFTIIMINVKKDPRLGMVLIVILHGVALSFFSSLLFHLVFLFQAFFAILLFRKRKLFNAESQAHHFRVCNPCIPKK